MAKARGAIRRHDAVAITGAWLAIGGFVCFALVWFTTQFHVPARRPLAIAGEGIAGLVLVGWLAISWQVHLERSARGRTVRPVLDDDAPLHRVETSELPTVADAHAVAVRAIARLEQRADQTTLPALWLVRVGRGGVELLFGEALSDAPVDMELVADGHGLRVVRESELPGALVPSERSLIELGADLDGWYFAPSDQVIVVGNDDPGRHLRTGEVPPLVVVRDGADVVVEPFGLRLAAPPAQVLEWFGAHVSPEVLGLEDTFEDRLPEAVELAEVAPAPPAKTKEAAGNESIDWLVAPGPIEVRILREEPDLVGDLLAPPDRPAIEFVAYLATHSYRASTARLRDALGTAKSQRSRSGKTVWSAAGSARTCLGESHVPPASGTQPYVLDEEVSCDWGRFQSLLRLAKARADEPELARQALIQALSLVEGVPAAASQRFSWLDSEHFLSDIAAAVLTASAELAELCLSSLSAKDARELVTWAIRKGRLLEPRALVLDELEARLEHHQARA